MIFVILYDILAEIYKNVQPNLSFCLFNHKKNAEINASGLLFKNTENPMQIPEKSDLLLIFIAYRFSEMTILRMESNY